MKNSPKRILNQEQMEYRGNDFYDFDDDVDLLEFSPLYRELIDVSETLPGMVRIDSGGMKLIYKVFDKKTGRYLPWPNFMKNHLKNFMNLLFEKLV